MPRLPQTASLPALLLAVLLTAACTRPDPLPAAAGHAQPANTQGPAAPAPDPALQAGSPAPTTASPVQAPPGANTHAGSSGNAASGVVPADQPTRPHGARPNPSPRTLLPRAAEPSPATAALAKQIEAAIGEPRCETSTECRALAFGNRPCGGPERYLPYSIRTTDPARLEALAARHAAARKADDRASGAMSTCIALLPPEAVCKAQRCVLQNAPDALPIR